MPRNKQWELYIRVYERRELVVQVARAVVRNYCSDETYNILDTVYWRLEQSGGTALSMRCPGLSMTSSHTPVGELTYMYIVLHRGGANGLSAGDRNQTSRRRLVEF